jgi:hypothetical protein
MRCPDSRILSLQISVVLSLVLVFACVLVSGCSWKATPSQSYLVIVVDRLGNDFNGCRSESDDAAGSGLAELCKESVRFTHAFTTSTLSAAAAGSILTGQYPYGNGLRHNGRGELGTLSASVETVAERALQKGYRTLFVAGGAPLLRRTGLHQGFEIFDDSLQPNARRMHRPAREVADIFMKWIEGRLRTDDRSRNNLVKDPFFAVLHLADLQAPWSPSPDDSGRVRESTVRGQLQEIDETLLRLWTYLRREKLWDKTNIVLVGLQGDSADVRASEIPALDLHSDMTHVTLLIKEGMRSPAITSPPGQPEYKWSPQSWSFDVNVSLADVGATLMTWIDPKFTDVHGGDHGSSLAAALKGPGDSVEQWRSLDRLIVSESAWARWQLDQQLPIRVAIRRGPHLYIHDKPASTSSIYHTLTDAFEVSPLPKRNKRTAELEQEFGEIASRLGFQKFPGVTAQQILEERWARAFFSARLGARADERSPHISESDQQRLEAYSETSIAAKAWIDLQNWDKGVASPRATVCSQMVFSASPAPILSSLFEVELARVCPFRGAKEVAKWVRLPEGIERARVLDAIVRIDQQRASGIGIAEASHALGRIWETGSVRRKEIEGMEQLLSQPEANRLRQQVMRRMRGRPEL